MSKHMSIPLPKSWPEHVKSAVLHTISLATTAFSASCGVASNRADKLLRLKAELEAAKSEIALLKEEIDIKHERFTRIPAQKRPFYRPTERMRILKLKAARGWNSKQTAAAFLVSEQTISCWLLRVDERKRKSLLRLLEPVNKFPEFVRYIVCRLKLFFPSLGKARIARILARAGLHLGVTTVGRMLKKDMPPARLLEQVAETEPTRTVTAKYPNHVFHVDLTVVPTKAGFWVPWGPFSWAQIWPFCWWVAVVIDHFSRLIVGFAVFSKHPTSPQIRKFLGSAFQQTGKHPRYIISDKHRVFWCAGYKQWCKRKEISPRFGAVNKHGSISLIERFIRSMKDECTRLIPVPMRLKEMRNELNLYIIWHNAFRPHMGLGGKTPSETYYGSPPANEEPRYEPRPKWPRASRCASPQAEIRGKPGTRLELTVGYLEGRKHLPVISLREAA